MNGSSSQTRAGLRSFLRARRSFRPAHSFEVLEERCLLSLTARLVTFSPVQVPSGSGVSALVVVPQILIEGQTTPGAAVHVSSKGASRLDQTVRADASGHYHLRLRVPTGESPLQLVARLRSQTVGTAHLSVTRCDPVIVWNTIALDTIRTAAVGPTVASRDLALVQVAVYDAVEAVYKQHAGLYANITAAPGTSASAAASQAAYRVLVTQFPAQADALQASLTLSLDCVPDSPGKAQGIVVGDMLAREILALRAHDGSATQVNYVPGSGPGAWVPTPPKYLAALTPQWGQVTPFAIPNAALFRPGPPPALNSPEYAAAYNQVKQLGSVNSPVRTADQTAIAKFWSDVPGVTFTPPGHWNAVAQNVSMTAGLGLEANARLFAKLDVALADAAIVCWNTKYFYNMWRPVTAIRAGGTVGNATVAAEPSWTPLWPTPNFPGYDSGHSTFSGAAQVVLESVFGTHHAFTDSGDPTLNLPARQFQNFAQAANEAGMSRIYGGIHFAFDNTAGLASGRAIGQYVARHTAV